MGIIAVATLLVIAVGVFESHDFDPEDQLTTGEEYEVAFRDGLFQVVSIMTTTGFCTADFDLWNNFSRGAAVDADVRRRLCGEHRGGDEGDPHHPLHQDPRPRDRAVVPPLGRAAPAVGRRSRSPIPTSRKTSWSISG